MVLDQPFPLASMTFLKEFWPYIVIPIAVVFGALLAAVVAAGDTVHVFQYTTF